MEGNSHPRIIGACIVGCALVAGAYVASNFGASWFNASQPAAVTTETTPRVAIAVTDNDNNGIEDWRDEFITTEPIILPQATTTYTPPDTLTGQLGVNFFEGYLRSKTYGPFGSSREEIINDTVDTLSTETAHDLYDTPDITILDTWTDEDIVTYANTLALAITNNNNADIIEGELLILYDIVTNDHTERLPELIALSETYQGMRDDTLNIPVPAILIKQHLDLINTYHALHKDIDAMTLAIDDPAFALLRLKRYEDDARGLSIALENMYDSLVPYSDLIQPEDPALLFVLFSEEYKS